MHRPVNKENLNEFFYSLKQFFVKENKDYMQESAVYMKSETHGGEDVPIYARGPMAYLFDGYFVFV